MAPLFGLGCCTTGLPSGEATNELVEASIPDQDAPRKVLTRMSMQTPASDFGGANSQGGASLSETNGNVFSWLRWAPEPDSPCYRTLHEKFPGALPGQAVHARTLSALESEKYGFTPQNTLFGSSFCPDEINNEKGDLADILKSYWGSCFPLGGISGAPFVGATGFTAFSHHVPDGGNIFLAYGPHVAISETGEVGKYLREGQHTHSTACGAVIGAYSTCTGGPIEEAFDDVDMQMAWIKVQLSPHAARIKEQSDPMAALAYQAYEMVKVKIENIANCNFGPGYLALVGGIQINMPAPYEDHFLPLTFDIVRKGGERESLLGAFKCSLPEELEPPAAPAPGPKPADTKGKQDAKKKPAKLSRRNSVFCEVTPLAVLDRTEAHEEDGKARKHHALFGWLGWSPALGTPCYNALHANFPGALPGIAVHQRMRAALENQLFGFTPENTLFGASVCPDEINHHIDGLPSVLKDYWGECFPLGGISGAPFVGKTGFSAFSHHVPDGGNVLIFYGPHVGISETGEVGKHLREGQSSLSTACGAVIGAYHKCNAHCAKKQQKDQLDEGDIQMAWIQSQLAPHASYIQEQGEPMAALAYQAFEMVKVGIKTIVNNDFGSGYLALVGGIQLNMPAPLSDHFLPLVFDVRKKDHKTQDLLWAFSCPLTAE